MFFFSLDVALFIKVPGLEFEDVFVNKRVDFTIVDIGAWPFGSVKLSGLPRQ